jgi:hypothetical protein
MGAKGIATVGVAAAGGAVVPLGWACGGTSGHGRRAAACA